MQLPPIYVFNLRGNQRTSGELSKKEGGKIFGSGSRTPIAITLLVKNPTIKTNKATIHYHDIGDYLNREDKLGIIKKFGSLGNSEMPLKTLQPNEHGDWIKQRNDLFETFIPIEPEKKFDATTKSIFTAFSLGLGTNRDAWCYNSSKKHLELNIKKTLHFYNEQRKIYQKSKLNNPNIETDTFINYDSTQASWTDIWKRNLEKNFEYFYNENSINNGIYRCSEIYFQKNLRYDKMIR